MNMQTIHVSPFRKLLMLVLAISVATAMCLVVRSDATAKPDAAGAIQFRILRITCLDQTVDLLGDDDVALGGTVASKFGIDLVDYTYLGELDDDQDDGDGVPTQVEFDSWVFAEIPIEEMVDYARVQLSLVEVDLGGKEDFLANLAKEEYEYVRVEMLAYFITLLEGLQETAVSTADAEVAFIPFGWLVGRALQHAAGAVIDHILGILWDWLIGSFEDDFFRVQFVEAPVPDILGLVAAGAEAPSETGTLVFVDHGARYELEYQWTGVGPAVSASGAPDDYKPTYSFDREIAEMRVMWLATFSDQIYFPLIHR